jgi:hypothetical protein
MPSGFEIVSDVKGSHYRHAPIAYSLLVKRENMLLTKNKA